LGGMLTGLAFLLLFVSSSLFVISLSLASMSLLVFFSLPLSFL
jgi:hypothetical protein